MHRKEWKIINADPPARRPIADDAATLSGGRASPRDGAERCKTPLTPHTATNDAPANPREFEAAILIEGALRLQDVQRRWDSARHEVAEALIYNRNLWSLLLASISNSAHPLPVEIRQNIANLGLFVTHQTMAITSDPRPEPLTSLIGINRELAAGLLGRA